MTRRLASFGLLLAALVTTAPALYAQQPDRTTPPKPGAPPALTLPAIGHHTLSNGLAVWLVESHKVPLVQVNVTLRSGSADDPAGKFGLANLTAGMLDEGAGGRSALEISDAIEGLGATLATTSSFDATAVRLNVPVGRLGAALPLLADIVLRPTFAAADLERLRQERLTSLLQARDEPSSIAGTAFARQIFGTHRYGTGAMGTEETVRGFSVADLKAFHAQQYVPSRAALIVVGDVKAATLLPLLEKHFAGWKGTGAPAAALTAPPQLAARRVVLVDKPGAAQSIVRVGWVGAPRATPDYHTLDVLNTMLGGSFSSRLNMNLREEHGYAYGASSAFDMRRLAGPFVAAANVQTDKTAESVREILKELTNIATPVPAEELERTRSNLTLGYPAEFETTSQLSRKMEDLFIYGLPDSTLRQYIPGVRAVTAAQLQTAAARYIQPGRMLVLVVGDRAVVEAGLRALNLGTVEVQSVAAATGRTP